MKTSTFQFMVVLTILAIILSPLNINQVAAYEGQGGQIRPDKRQASKNSLTARDDDLAVYIIQLQDLPIASYRGGTMGLAATNPKAAGTKKLNITSDASVKYSEYLLDQQEDAIKVMNNAMGREIEIISKFQYAFNGLAVRLSAEEAAILARQPSIRMIEKERLLSLETDVSPGWIGAPGIWDGSTTGGLPGTKGEGIIIGVIDSGINSDHPSFADIGEDGYDHINPLGNGSYLGYCTTPEGTGFCNDKLIGAYDFVYSETPSNGLDYPSPEDEDGHGSHVASIAAGNVVNANITNTYTPTVVLTSTLASGIAPHANIIAYDSCYKQTSTGHNVCPSEATLEAIEQAVIDGVDILNYSIDGGSDPYNDANELALLTAFDAGIYVATSAGNDGPDAGSVGHLSPWVTTAGAVSHRRVFTFTSALENMTGGITSPPADILGRGITGSYGPAPIVDAGDYGDRFCATPFPTGTWTNGEIVICTQSMIGAEIKAVNVKSGGAGGVVIANTRGSGGIFYDISCVLPAIQIDFESAVELQAWLDFHLVFLPLAIKNGTANTLPPEALADHPWIPMASIQASTVHEELEPTENDRLADFSARGPNSTLDTLKPDIIAPGEGVLAAVASPNPQQQGIPEYGLYEGTSVASPHIAGAGALLKALHPTWSPAQIKSAIMTTANTMVMRENSTTLANYLEMGSGRIDLSKAGLAGLVLDESTSNFENANPEDGGDPKTLNIASVYSNECINQCSWVRTLESVADETTTWTVEITSTTGMSITVTPNNFSLSTSESQELVITATTLSIPDGEWGFGSIQLIPNTAYASTHLPVVAQSIDAILPEEISIETRHNQGSQVESGLKALEITELTIETFGLTQGIQTDGSLSQDSTESDPFDDLNDGIFYTFVDVTTNAPRLVSEIVETTSANLNLYIGLDGGNNIPEATEVICASATNATLEYCDVPEPENGRYWILVQNSEAGDAPPDDFNLVIAVVEESDVGNLTIEGPNSVPLGTPFDLNFIWDIPSMLAGDRWYGACTLGTAADEPGNLAEYIPIDLIRHPDGVSKTVNDDNVNIGETLTYTITIEPNVTPIGLNYTLTDTIPAGLSYLTGTAYASDGMPSVEGSVLTWNGLALPKIPKLSEIAASEYQSIEFSLGVVDYCESEPACDEVIVKLTDLDYYYQGKHYSNLQVSSNGFAVAGRDDLSELDLRVNQDMPDPTGPNNVIAPWWTDLNITGEEGKLFFNEIYVGSGISYYAIEWHRAQRYNDPESVFTFQLWIQKGTDEIWFQYENMDGDTSTASVGFENHDGSIGDTYYYNSTGTLPSGSVDLAIVENYPPPITISYQVEADSNGTWNNLVEWITDNPGDILHSISTPVTVNETR